MSIRSALTAIERLVLTGTILRIAARPAGTISIASTTVTTVHPDAFAACTSRCIAAGERGASCAGRARIWIVRMIGGPAVMSGGMRRIAALAERIIVFIRRIDRHRGGLRKIGYATGKFRCYDALRAGQMTMRGRYSFSGWKYPVSSR
jgi:hypothetical protein